MEKSPTTNNDTINNSKDFSITNSSISCDSHVITCDMSVNNIDNVFILKNKKSKKSKKKRKKNGHKNWLKSIMTSTKTHKEIKAQHHQKLKEEMVDANFDNMRGDRL